MFLTPNLKPESRRRLLWGLSASAVALLVVVGAFAKNGWFPSTDAMTGERSGWFGAKLPKSAPSSWNPLAMPTATPTPQLSKENIYAGGRLLAVEDKNANAAPPTDLAVWRRGTGAWYVMGPGGSIADAAGWGNCPNYPTITTCDIPVPGDYDGDGKTDFAVARRNTSTNYIDWYFIYSSNGSTAGFSYGLDTDTPVVADYDGDGKTDVAVYRSSSYVWYVLHSSTTSSFSYTATTGASGDKPAPADYDGDGKADPTVWRDSNATFYTKRSTDAGSQTTTFGTSGDVPVPCDYDGDGKANYALRHNADWLIRNPALSSTTTTTPSGDSSSDIPVPGDYDADGKCDIAVWRDSNGDWYIRKSGSSNALRQDHWGQSGDIPVPAYWRR